MIVFMLYDAGRDTVECINMMIEIFIIIFNGYTLRS